MMTIESDGPNFEGYQPRTCGDHRTVGSYRAWCFDCNEWCYNCGPDPAEMGCRGCREGAKQAKPKLRLTKREQRAIGMVLDPARAQMVISAIND